MALRPIQPDGSYDQNGNFSVVVIETADALKPYAIYNTPAEAHEIVTQLITDHGYQAFTREIKRDEGKTTISDYRMGPAFPPLERGEKIIQHSRKDSTLFNPKTKEPWGVFSPKTHRGKRCASRPVSTVRS